MAIILTENGAYAFSDAEQENKFLADIAKDVPRLLRDNTVSFIDDLQQVTMVYKENVFEFCPLSCTHHVDSTYW